MLCVYDSCDILSFGLLSFVNHSLLLCELLVYVVCLVRCGIVLFVCCFLVVYILISFIFICVL